MQTREGLRPEDFEPRRGRAMASESVASRPRESVADDWRETKRRKRERERLRRRVAALETRIETLESEIESVDEALSARADDPAEVSRLLKARQASQETLEAAMAEWESAASALD